MQLNVTKSNLLNVPKERKEFSFQ